MVVCAYVTDMESPKAAELRGDVVGKVEFEGV